MNGFEEDLKTFVSKNADGSETSHEVVALSAAQLPFTWHCWHAVWVKVMKYVYKVSRSVPLLIR